MTWNSCQWVRRCTQFKAPFQCFLHGAFWCIIQSIKYPSCMWDHAYIAINLAEEMLSTVVLPTKKPCLLICIISWRFLLQFSSCSNEQKMKLGVKEWNSFDEKRETLAQDKNIRRFLKSEITKIKKKVNKKIKILQKKSDHIAGAESQHRVLTQNSYFYLDNKMFQTSKNSFPILFTENQVAFELLH